MPKPPGSEDPRAVPPTQFPETTPPSYPSVDHSFTVQGIFDLKGSVSKLEQAVVHLEQTMTELKADLKALQKTVWLATGAVVILSALVTFFGSRMWDTMMRINDYMLRHP